LLPFMRMAALLLASSDIAAEDGDNGARRGGGLVRARD
jgi:hypothetical protein